MSGLRSRLQKCFSLMSIGKVAIVFVLAAVAVCAYGQDDAAMAAQQANQQALQAMQQAADQAAQASQQAMQDAQRANDQAMQNAQNNATLPVTPYTAAPSFSVKAGTVSAGTIVRLKSSTHYATIYYTTNGWTPTTASPQYKGPITITRSMQVQAIAVAPNMMRSVVATANYVVPGTTAQMERSPAVTTNGVLTAGTRLHFVTTTSTDSKTAQVGDHLKLALDQDVEIDGTVVVPKGTPVEAVITQADPSARAGTPGDLAFEIKSLKFDGLKVPLQGGETIEGANHYDRAKGLALIPVVGFGALAVHGNEAEIKPGMSVTATVERDIVLKP